MSQEVFGANRIRELTALISAQSVQALFLVTGKQSFAQESITQALQPLLERFPCQRFCDFEKNPRLADVEKGIALFRTLKNPIIVAIGGGSVIDMAKLIAFFAPLSLSIKDSLQEGICQTFLHPSPVFLLAVPTTAGTGSEATQFATVYLDRTKYSLDHPAILPDAVILDPALTLNLPPKETAASGLDALTQAIESYWSVQSSDVSKAYAREAIPLLYQNLEKAVLSPSLESRAAMLRGANLAGKAINITRTTAAHAISYPMTAHFQVPHGQAVSLSLPYFMDYNNAVTESDILDPRGVAYVKQTLREIAQLMGHSSIEDAKMGFIALMRRIGAKTTLKELGILQSDWHLIVQEGFNPQRVRNNPRELTTENLSRLLAQFES